MPSPDPLATEIAKWVEKAEQDLSAAVHLVRLADAAPTDAVCFHSQQCVEKYVKAVLVANGQAFRKTHDIAELVALLPAGSQPGATPDEQDRLTDYATIQRYPGDYDPIPLPEARRSVAAARRVRREMRRLLPQAALRRRRK